MATAKEKFLQACKDVVAAHDAGQWSNSRDSLAKNAAYQALNEYERSDEIFGDTREMSLLRSSLADVLDSESLSLIPGDSKLIEKLRAAIATVEGQQ